jgi:hypothetical protein
MWKLWVTAVLGLLVLAVPFLNLSAEALTWTLALAGLAVAVLSVWHASEMGILPESRDQFAHR